MITLSIPFSKDELASLDEEVFSFGKTRVEVVRELVHNFNKEKQEAKIIAGIREAEREYEQGLAITGDIEEILARM